MKQDILMIDIRKGSDVTLAVVETQHLLASKGLERSKSFLIATAVSELARNALVHAGGGQIELGMLTDGDRYGFEVVAEDHGPGIPDVELAFQAGYSTGHSLGLGLPGVRRIMDEVEVATGRPEGCRIAARKWL